MTLKAVNAAIKKEQARIKAEKIKREAQIARGARKAPKLVNMPEPVGNAEQDALAELDAVKQGFRERAKTENERFQNVVDSAYWFAVCFRTREQKERFLQEMKWLEFGDTYLSGDEVAKKMKVRLPKAKFGKTEPKIDKDYADLAL